MRNATMVEPADITGTHELSPVGCSNYLPYFFDLKRLFELSILFSNYLR